MRSDGRDLIMKPIEIREAVEIPYKPKHAGGRPRGKSGKGRKFSSDEAFKAALTEELREFFQPNPKRGEKRAEDVFTLYNFVKGYRFTPDVLRYNLHEVLGWHSQRTEAVFFSAVLFKVIRLASGRMGRNMVRTDAVWQLTTRHDISREDARKSQGGSQGRMSRSHCYGFGIMPKAVNGVMPEAVALRDKPYFD